ncbi:MAG: ParB/RepB/Spo0J family partition protein, partial [Haliangium ochraceum]
SLTRRALGRGLAALIPAAATVEAVPAAPANASTAPAAGVGVGVGRPAAGVAGNGRDATEPREGLRVVGIEEVHPARAQPRKTFDDGRLDELAASIRNQGLIQPLVVRVREAGGYEIIAGERRWRAAQRAGMHTIPVVVREIAHARAFELAMVENLQREDLNAIEEAEGLDRLIREFGYTQESLAARIGKDRTTVTNALRLLKLPPGVRGLVVAGRLSMGHARAILGLESLTVTPTAGADATATGAERDIAERMERMGRKAAARDMSVRQIEALVRREKADAVGAPVPETPATNATASGRDLATRLSRALGMRVRVVESGAGHGHLEIHYASLDQLDGVLAKLLA